MKILALDTSAVSASCAVTENGKVLASAYVNTPLTHSQTLMPMVENMLKNAALSAADVDVLAVSAGPGSFTGVRIGVAAVKGMAFTKSAPCVGVSTLAAIAQNAAGIGFCGVICAAMDARCGQVYTALFESDGKHIGRITEDEAISAENLKNRLISFKKPVFLLGDGAKMCYTLFKVEVPSLILAPEHLRYPHALGVAAQAEIELQEGNTVTAEALQPIYLRLPQAERELRARKAKEGQ